MRYWKFKAATMAALVLILLGLGCNRVRAETVGYTHIIPLQTTNWAEPLALPRFDPALGILMEIEFVLSGEVVGTAKIENLDAAAAQVTAESHARVQLQRPDGSAIAMASPNASRITKLAAYDGTSDFVGASGAVITGINDLDIAERTVLTDPSQLAAFSGSGTITLEVKTTGASTASGAGNLAFSFSTLASAVLTVTYHFEQPAIALAKATNGFDADFLPGPLLNSGVMVTWHYTVTNIGNVPLVDLMLFDDQEGDVTAGCPQRTLAISESILCIAQGIARLGQYTNTATVTGTVAPDLPGQPRQIHATDRSHYYGTPLSFCPPGATASALLPALLYLGEGQGNYTLPVGYQQLVVKKFSPLRFETLTASTYQSTRRTHSPERVWACTGDCTFATGLNQLLPLGKLPISTRLHIAVVDDDDDSRENALIANHLVDQPIERVEIQELTEHLHFVLPFAAEWGFYAADSIGLHICVEP